MPQRSDTLPLSLHEVERYDDGNGVERLRLQTNRGVIEGRLHRAYPGDVSVLWVFGAGGGLGGPAGGAYARLAEQLRPSGVTSLELDYRNPGYLRECVQDVLLGIEYLVSQGKQRIVLVGHSFGGAVVITAGAFASHVIAVAALSSQTRGTESVRALSPRRLLLAHGTADEVLPDSCSRDIFARAGEPKELILYEGCRHGLDGCREELDRDMMKWIGQVNGTDPA
jgi:hypothetical protein